MNDLEILDIEEIDIDKVAELSYQVGKMHDNALPNYFLPTSKEEHIRIIKNILVDENAKILKAVMNNVICGFCCLCIQDNKRSGFVYSKIGYIYNFGVDEKYQNKGVGTKILEKVEKFFIQKNVDVVNLSVFNFNEKALNFYKKSGYEVIDVNMRKVLKK